MRIATVEAIPLEYPLETPSQDATGVWATWNTVLVRIRTDDGFEGWGEIGPVHGGGTLVYKSLVEHRLAPRLIGADPLRREHLWHEMLGTGTSAYAFGRSGAIVSAIAGVDIALWDIAGKAFNVPVYQMLGGKVHDRIPAYASGFFGKQGRALTPDECAEEAERYAREGFRGVKMKVGFGISVDRENLRAVRQVLGPDRGIMVDANQAFSLTQARRFVEECADLGLTFFEEPLPMHDLNGLAALSATSPVPIAAGENLYTRFEFREVFERRAVHIVQPDVIHVGGISEMWKIAALAGTWGMPFCPHIHATIGVAASIQVMAAVPNIIAAEYITTGGSYELRLALCGESYTAKDGWIAVPDEPGLGITVNPEAIERYRIHP